MTPYNFDVLQGASYRIDPTAPVGNRVKDLRFKGRDVKESDLFSLAVNSYRAQGSGGYTALKGTKVLRTYNDEVRELLVERLRKAGTIQPVTDRNWVLAPETIWAPVPFRFRSLRRSRPLPQRLDRPSPPGSYSSRA